MTRPFAHLLVFGCLSFILIGCGGGSSTPPPPPPAISVSFSTAPPTSLNVSATAPIVVNVSNDTSNSGVTFSCTPTGACGTFTAITATTATYNAPATVPSGGSATIIATSVKDSTKSANASVTIANPPPTITVSISTPPPATLTTASPNNTAMIAATTNDTAGVTWSCTPTNACGSFNPTATLTAVTTTFTAPTAVPAGSAVTVTATSVTDTTKSAQAIVNITGTASLASLNGHYAFLVQSPTGSRGTATWVGSVILDGAGNVSGGVEDVVSPTRDDQNDPILATGATNPNTHLPSVSKYSVDPSGHGQIIMSTLQGETLTISFEITSANSSGVTTHAEIIEADGTGGEAGDPGSGSLDLQSTSATISGAYSFTVTGVNATSPYPVISLGGVINVTNSTTIGGSIDTAFGGVFTPASITQGNLLTGPDANLRGTFSIVAPGAPTPSHSFTYYAVSSKVLRIFDNGGSSFTGGSMYSQGSSPSTGLSNSYVYQHSGWSTAGRTVAVGQLTASSGTISGGFSDSNSGGKSAITPKTPTVVSGSYAASATESGTINVSAFTDAAGSSTFNVYPVDPTLNILDPNNSSGGGGALVLHTDANINGTGILLPQVSPKVFSSNYAVNLLNAIDTPTPNEVDLVGILTSDGSANFTASLADYTHASVTPAPQIDAPLSGTFAADPSYSGRYTGSLSVTSLAGGGGYSYPTAASTPTATKNTFNVVIYQATTTQAFVIETDTQAITIGQIVQQNLP